VAGPHAGVREPATNRKGILHSTDLYRGTSAIWGGEYYKGNMRKTKEKRERIKEQ
jgi:hypothetical protein